MQYRLTIDVFCHVEQTSNAGKALAEQRAFARCKVAVRDGGLARAVTHYADHPSPHLIIVEDDGDTSTLQSRLDALAQVVEPGRKLIVVGAVNDISVYRRIVSLGVTDYLVSPLSLEGMMDAIERAAHDPKGPERCKFVAVTGARGGVGASTIAHNMAWAAAKRLNIRTILADMDLTFGTAGLAFNQDPRQAFGEAFADADRLDITLLERYMAGDDENLQILSTPGALRQYDSIDEEAVDKAIDLCRQMAKLVIVDVPHVWTDWSEGLLTRRRRDRPGAGARHRQHPRLPQHARLPEQQARREPSGEGRDQQVRRRQAHPPAAEGHLEHARHPAGGGDSVRSRRPSSKPPTTAR